MGWIFVVIVLAWVIGIRNAEKQAVIDNIHKTNADLKKEIDALKKAQEPKFKRSTWTQHNPW